jgi:hypothetical protein
MSSSGLITSSVLWYKFFRGGNNKPNFSLKKNIYIKQKEKRKIIMLQKYLKKKENQKIKMKMK